MAGVGTSLVLLGLVTGNPVLVLVGLAAAVASALTRWLSADVALPAAVLLLVLAAITSGQAAAVVGVDLLARPAALAFAQCTLAVGCLALAGTRAQRGMTGALRGRGAVLALAPASAALLIGLLQSLSTQLAAAWGLLGTDLAEHVLLLGRVQEAGALSYGDEIYPRGLHVLAAMASGPMAGADRSPELLLLDLRVMAALSWLALAVVLWTGAVLAARLGAAVGLSPRMQVAAALSAGTLPLVYDALLGTFVFMGAAPSLLAVVVLWALPLVPLALGEPRRQLLVAVVVGAAGTVLLAHLWQALVVVPAIALLTGCFVPGPVARAKVMLRQGATTRSVLALLSGICLAVASAAPPMLSLTAQGGTSLAGTAGELPAPSWPLLVLALLAVPCLRRSRAAASWRLLVGSALGLLVVTAVMLAGAGGGLDLTQYYPLKSLWLLLLLLLPALCVGFVVALTRLAPSGTAVLGRLRALPPLVPITLSLCVAAAAFAFVLPRVVNATSLLPLALSPDRSGLVERRLDIAIEHGSRHEPRVVVPIATAVTDMPDPRATYIVSKLLSFQTGQLQSDGNPLVACEDVQKVAAGRPAVVVTDLEVGLMAELLVSQGCGPVPVVRSTGGSPAGLDFLSSLLGGADGQ